MNVKIPYGKELKTVNIPEPCTVLLPHKIDVSDETKTIEDALKNPIGMNSFKTFIQNSSHLLVIVNDASKPTPTAKIIEHIYPLFAHHPDVKFLIAAGTHRPPNEEECQYIFGKFYDLFKDRIFIHDSKKEENMKYLGKTKRGTEVSLNKMIFDAGNVLVIGSIEPHYFAGYTGGRKALIPGVASYQTIEMNHQFALSDKACSLSLKNNPIHNDMIDAIKLVKNINIYSIQTVLTNDYKIYAASCGDIIKSFNALIPYANNVYCTPSEKKGNIVLTVVPYPMDIDLYQSQHALENGNFILDDNGVLILVSKCRMGVGNDAFLKVLSKTNTPQEVLDLHDGKYKLGIHKSIRILKIVSRAQLFAVTSLKNSTIEKAKMKPYNSIQNAIDDAVKIIKTRGDKPRVVLMPSGNLTVPLI